MTLLKPVSCDHVTSFNYDGKKAKDVGLTCWCHLSSMSSFVFIWCVVFNQGCFAFIRYSLLKSCCEWILMQPWTQVIDFSLPGLTWHIRLRSGISHLSISGIMVHGRCYISHCFYFSIIFLWIFVGWSLFFVFVFLFLDNNLSNQESILTCLFSF